MPGMVNALKVSNSLSRWLPSEPGFTGFSDFQDFFPGNEFPGYYVPSLQDFIVENNPEGVQ